MEGIDSVKVSLNQGQAAIRLSPDNTSTIAQIRQKIRDNGFNPKDAKATVEGTISLEDGRLYLTFARQDQKYEVTLHPEYKQEWSKLQKALGSKHVLTRLRVHIPETTGEEKAELVFQVIRIIRI